jgi:hypothetical protein
MTGVQSARSCRKARKRIEKDARNNFLSEPERVQKQQAVDEAELARVVQWIK